MILHDNRKRSAIVCFIILFSALNFFAQSASTDSPQFTTVIIPSGADPDALAVADINADGVPDIVAVNPASGTVTVLLGDRNLHFRPAAGSPFAAGQQPTSVGIGDFNADGHSDLLIANHQTSYVTLLLGDGKGGFRPAPHSPFTVNAKPHPHGVAIGHFCGNDQPLDAVIDSWGTEQVELLIGDGRGGLKNGPMFPAGPGSDLPLRSADLNRDGFLDIVMPDTAIGRWNANRVSVLLGDGKCGFHAAPGSPFPAGAVPWSIAVGDLDGDGIPDMVLTPYGPQVRDPHQIAASVLLGDGTGSFHPMPGSPFALPGCAGPRRVALGSISGGRLHDFAVTCANTSSVLLFLGQQKGGFRLTTLDVASASDQARRTAGSPPERGILFADLTGQGKDGLIISNGSAGTITLLLPK